jgi:hypothetical protein
MISDNLLSHDDNKVIPPLILTKYHQMGFKLIPLGDDSKTPTVRSTNGIHNDPNYWTEEKLIKDCSRFLNIATTFGITDIAGTESDENKKVYLHCLDIDSDNVLAILFNIVEELKSKTFVTKTKKDCGYHIYWLSHSQHPSIGVSKCKPGYVTIKSDNTLGLCTLPPSRHRDDPHFHYHSTGLEDRIMIDDELYEKLLQLLSPECLKCNTTNNTKSKSSPFTVYKNLTDSKIERIIADIKDNYQKGYRDQIIFGFSGLLFKSKIALQSAKYTIARLCDITQDEEKSSRLKVVQDTYLKGLDGSEIKGATQLLDAFAEIHNEDQDYANQILTNICQILDVKEEDWEHGNNNGNDNNGNPSTAQLLIRLAQENTSQFFQDQYGIAYAKIKMADHNEIIALERYKV